MTRETPEWIGATPDTPVPTRVRLRVYERYGGRCYLTNRKIMPGDAWETDHIIALANGGTNCESNLAPALSTEHKAKTAADVAQKSKDRRVKAKHIGLHKPKAIVPGSRASKFKKKLNGQVVLRDGK